MNLYDENIATSLENSRNSLRRIARNDDTEFSNQSILNLMEKFVKSVNAMDETILVPCRLMDMKVGDENDPTHPKTHNQKSQHSVQQLLSSVDLFQVYNMLNSVKADLLWGQGQQTSEETNLTVPQVKGHVRRPSSVSVASTNSSICTISDSESDTGNENDSGIEESREGCYGDRSEQVAQNFRRHLVGLTQSLRQMTEAAQYLALRYQHDIGGPV